jgi:GNAT superfamily N-acetyltransferase
MSIHIDHTYAPGAIGRITEMHAAYYAQQWGFGVYFEAKVATDLSVFLSRFDTKRDGFWLARQDEGQIVGSMAIDGIKADTDGAHLRWFILDPVCQGQGIGNRLMTEAINFCLQRKYTRIYLWTFAGLDAARHLYEKHGFTLCQELNAEQWGITMQEQMFELVNGDL